MTVNFRGAVSRFRLGSLRKLRVRYAAKIRARATGCFVAVTGSSAKSTTTALLVTILETQGRIQKQVLDNTINPLIKTVRRGRDADFVVAELGVGGIGQMAQMAGLFQPNVAVVTMVGLEHLSAFRSAEAIALEKGELIAATRADGLVALNADDPLVMGMAARTAARIVTFGTNESATCRILGVSGGLPVGITVRLIWRGESFEVATGFVGAHFALPVAAAVLVGLELGLTIADVRTALESCRPLPVRLSVHEISGGPVIIADCAKAPIGSILLAFDVLREVEGRRRRIVLGTISDYKSSRSKTYRTVVQQALEVADEVVVVTDSGGKSWAPAEALAAGSLRIFAHTEQAADHIIRTAIPDEAILLKGSANLHLERILLRLQGVNVRCWETSCGRIDSCLTCGLYRVDFAAHRNVRRRQRLLRILCLGKWESSQSEGLLP